MPDRDVSAVLPIHASAGVEELDAALASLRTQTVPLQEVVLVVDGAVGGGLRDVVSRDADRGWVRLVELPVNGGPGVANQAGLEAARCAWVLKADADDLSEPDRAAVLLGAAEEGCLDVVGSAMWEFDVDPARPSRIRRVPLTHAEIRARMRWNNPMNHPTVLYRRDLALRVGGYPSWRSMEDYALFMRLMVSGARFGNLPSPTVRFRADRAMRARRSGLTEHAAYEVAIRRELRSLLGVGRWSSGAVMGLRLAARAAPPAVIGAVSNTLLTRQGDAAS